MTEWISKMGIRWEYHASIWVWVYGEQYAWNFRSESKTKSNAFSQQISWKISWKSWKIIHQNHQTRSIPSPLCSRGAGLSLLSREICLSMTIEAAAFTRSSASPLRRYLTGLVSAGGHFGCEKKHLWDSLKMAWTWTEMAGTRHLTINFVIELFKLNNWMLDMVSLAKGQATNSCDHSYHADIVTLCFFITYRFQSYIQEHKTLRFQYLLLVQP